MIHQIKSLHNNGNGLSERKIAKQLGISRNTVSKYLAMPVTEISTAQMNNDRNKKLDDYRDYVIQLLQTYPGLSAVKVLRKLKTKVETLSVSDRSVRRYIQELKQEVSFKQARYYEPVLDMVPGEQCQVDGGELRRVMIDGKETTVYIMVFVLSYSRLMHVSVSAKPINTEMLIQQHDAAFRYFDGMPQECVYDQTKLVVISETFRELDLNQRFHQYATAAGFHIHACEGYDPESKGKVEAGVKYVKQNGLYGEDFANWKDLERYMADWLDTIANQRNHGTTGKQPRVHYEQAEQVHMLTYFSPSCLKPSSASHIMTRKADKTGLISWQSNKYSVPLLYQSTQVGVTGDGSQLRISDLASGEIIAEHSLCLDKGKIFKNRDHYRDKVQDIETLESEVIHLLGENETASQALCDVLKNTTPRFYKDQLRGAKQIIIAHVKAHGEISTQLLLRLIDTPRLTATGQRDRLSAYQQGLEQNKTPITENTPPEGIKAELTKQANKALAHYAALNGHLSGQGESHVVH